MYKELIISLKEKGVIFDQGLSEKEISCAEKEYKIAFPKEWRQFYSIALPISVGFYNWRDRTDENIKYIKKNIDSPMTEIMEDIDDIYWCDEWGEEPIESKEKRKIIIEKIRSAPKLIPIYSHRYLASIEVKQNPVFSISGTDVIYYGENLLSYYLIEFGFGLKQYDTMNCDNISHIHFWSDLL